MQYVSGRVYASGKIWTGGGLMQMRMQMQVEGLWGRKAEAGGRTYEGGKAETSGGTYEDRKAYYS